VYDIVIARATTDSPEFFFMGGLGGLEKLFHGMLSSHTFDLKRKLSWLLHHLGWLLYYYLKAALHILDSKCLLI
jgi:hypothetical protein